jgi:hypothetical protein
MGKKAAVVVGGEVIADYVKKYATEMATLRSITVPPIHVLGS